MLLSTSLNRIETKCCGKPRCSFERYLQLFFHQTISIARHGFSQISDSLFVPLCQVACMLNFVIVSTTCFFYFLLFIFGVTAFDFFFSRVRTLVRSRSWTRPAWKKLWSGLTTAEHRQHPREAPGSPRRMSLTTLALVRISTAWIVIFSRRRNRNNSAVKFYRVSLGSSGSLVVFISAATAPKLHMDMDMDMATPPRQSLASTMEMTSQRRSSISSQVGHEFRTTSP